MPTAYARAHPRGPAGLRGRVLPTTPWGRLACSLSFAFVVWFSAWIGVAALGVELREILTGPVFVTIVLAMLFDGIAAGVIALVAIARHGERSVLAIASLVPALFAAGLFLFELLAPH